MSNYEKLANEIIENVGGLTNIDSVTNCMTRLRFGLKDNTKVNEDGLKATPGVQGTVYKGGQFQVIIGTDVSNVSDEIRKKGNFSDSITEDNSENKGIINKVLGTITSIFQPIIPAICGAGMLRALLALLVFFEWLNPEDQTYQLLNLLADSAFYFLPVILAITSAYRFKANPYYAAVLGAMLIHPTFTAMVGEGTAINFAGLPVKAISYGSAVIPPILIVLVMSYVEKFAKKISPNAVKIFLVPLIVFLITAPLAWIIIGPMGGILGDMLLVVFEFLNNQARWVIPVLMGAFTPFFVMTGMHYSFMPVQLAQYATLGYGTLLGPGMLASNLSQAGSSLAIGLKTKNKVLKQTALSSSATALFGITEPALYGVTLKLKTPLWIVVFSGGVAGLWAGLTNMRTYASATAGILALPVYVTEDMSNVLNAVICIVIAFVLSFVLAVFFVKVDSSETVEESDEIDKNIDTTTDRTIFAAEINQTNIEVKSPVSGNIIPNNEIQDDVFRNQIMGNTIAVDPIEGEFYAPFDAEVVSFFPTKHAIGLKSTTGIELLIHIGIDTVELDGDGFHSDIKVGDQVKKGDHLISVDINLVKEKGYSMITPIVVTNTQEFTDVVSLPEKKNVSNSDTIMLAFS
ncbi:PTS glucose transporter subunit IIA [Desemzia sp. RIT804]|uniref:beta-glucoside-specific PTS transporter subunit IIABC n=1 Tax=Desemzia sp. RIT 804 TaxID=2810209 RepID=UPI001951D13A|nr:beta-glucoside-specific PTS transporter subunit IIABC [Desemzia sp. RIT 804]MBM6615299.1 PTS glucose transporter subunit IIA [Desemzia sp. RIT 804]